MPQLKYDSLLGQLRETDTSGPVFFLTDSEGNPCFRFCIRSSILMLDKKISSLGFSGFEDTDWVNINSFE